MRLRIRVLTFPTGISIPFTDGLCLDARTVPLFFSRRLAGATIVKYEKKVASVASQVSSGIRNRFSGLDAVSFHAPGRAGMRVLISNHSLELH